MSETNVAGVTVDTRHWIGGRRVASPADLDLAVGHAVGQYDNAGQVCLAGTRLLVEEPVAEEFTAPPAQPKQSADRRASGATHREGGNGMGQRG